MKIYSDNSLSLSEAVITIGTFDGIHQGHQKLIKKARERATVLDIPLVVYTFDPPPRAYFGNKMVLTNIEKKLECLRYLGVDYTIVAEFNQQYASRSAEDFINELKMLCPKEIWVGPNFTFGKQKLGNIETLSYFFQTHVHPLVTCDKGEIISSTRIRELIQHDQSHLAEELLGRNRMKEYTSLIQ